MFTIAVDAEVSLELLHPRRAEEVFALIDSNRNFLGPWATWPDSVRTVEDELAFMHEALARFACDLSIPCLITRCGGEIVGAISLEVDPSSRTGEIGYWLGAAFQGRGFVTRSVRTLVDVAFDHLRLDLVEIRCGPDNVRSCAVARRLGFNLDLVGRRSSGSAIDGPRQVWRMRADEWRRDS